MHGCESGELMDEISRPETMLILLWLFGSAAAVHAAGDPRGSCRSAAAPLFGKLGEPWCEETTSSAFHFSFIANRLFL